MPHALELEEFGLEVEQEHHALMGSSDDAASAADGATSTSTTHRRTQHVALSTPSKEQRSLLQSINVRPARLLRPGMFKWATLLIALALVVFLNIGQESEEAIYFEEALPNIDTCEDDDIAFTNMFKSENNCFEFVLASSNDGQTERCNIPIGIPDENEFQKLLKHFCRKSCGLCGNTEDDQLFQGESSRANIEAAVEEIEGEIEEKELEVKLEMERAEQAREKQLAKAIEEEIEAQEEERAHNSAPGSKPLNEEDNESVTEHKGIDVNKLLKNTTATEGDLAKPPCQDESSAIKFNCTDVSKLSNNTLRGEVCNATFDESDEENETHLQIVKLICRMSCGLCGDGIDSMESVEASGDQESRTHDEKKSVTAGKSIENKMQNGDSLVDDEMEQSNNDDGDEKSSASTEDSHVVVVDDDDNDEEEGEDENDDSSSVAIRNKLQKGDDRTIR